MTLAAVGSTTRLDPSAAPSGGEVWLRSIEAAILIFRERAAHEMSIELVAELADLDLDDVYIQFPTRDDLLVATIQEWNARRMAPLLPIAERHGAVAFLRGIVQANVADPALMRLLVSTVNIAATPGHPLQSHLREQWIQFHAGVQRALMHDIAVGREPSTMEPARGAEQLIALYEGLQLQSMLRQHMNVLESYDRAVTRLRDGWSRKYESPVWHL